LDWADVPPPARISAWELLRSTTLQDHLAALDDIACHGLAACFAGQPVREIAAELVQLSRAGLQARVDAGIEKKKLSPIFGRSTRS
jgi:glutamate--cysteine ligase